MPWYIQSTCTGVQYGWFHLEITCSTSCVGIVQNPLTSKSKILSGILAYPNNTSATTQKFVPTTMRLQRRFHCLTILISPTFLNSRLVHQSWQGPWIERSGWLTIMNPLLMYYHRWLSCGVGRSTCALQNAFPDTDWCGYVPWRKFRSQRELCLPYPADCIQCDWISQPQLSGRQQVARKTRHDYDYRVCRTYIYSLVAEMLGRATTNYLLDFTSSQHGTSEKN